MKKVKTIEIENLQAPIFEELDDQTSVAVVGGASESGLVDLESQLEKLNPQTEVGKTLLKSLESLVRGAETRLEEEIKKI